MTNTEKILEDIKKRLAELDTNPKVENIGTVENVGDGVVSLSGLSKAAMGEIVEFEDGSLGYVLDLSEDTVSVVLLSESENIRTGMTAKKTDVFLTVNVSEEMLGRVLDVTGTPLDGGRAIKGKKRMPMMRIAPGIVERKPVDTPLMFGIKAIDSMIPVGRGQRELIIGDRGTGKTSVIIDAILNQKLDPKNKDNKRKRVICIYVAIGQKQVNIAQAVARLQDAGAMDYTVVISAAASAPASQQYLAPYAGTAIAEYFAEQGEDVLIAYDDLTRHAWAYRQISLVLKRPAGREAYPGDIFYLHSSLLERAVQFNDDNKGGSITALPVIETQAGDISAYIPTNVISITDGQIFLESDLFNSGIRPAINVGISVSRVGGAAQTQIMRKIAGPLRLNLAQYRSLAAFAQFGSDLDKATQSQLDRGARLTEILKQANYHPLPLWREVSIIWAATNGHLDDIAVSKCTEFEEEFLNYLERSEKKLVETITKEETLSDEVIKGLTDAVTKFKKTFKGAEAPKIDK